MNIVRRIDGALWWCPLDGRAVGKPIRRLNRQEAVQLSEQEYPDYPHSDPDTYIDVMDLPGRLSYSEIDVLEDDYSEDSMP